MELDFVARLIGVGPAHKKDRTLVGQADYRLKLFQEVIETTTKDGHGGMRYERIPGLMHIEGSVTGLENHAFWSEGTELTLTLEDGRRLDFQIALDGTIAAQRLHEASK